MKIIDDIYSAKEFEYLPFDIYFKNKRGAVFDIETTGLSPKKNALILSGFVIPQGSGKFLCRQIFAESLADEPLVIKETLKILSELDYIVTYNGASFDIPFLEKRMSFHKFKSRHMPYDLDLYKIVKTCSEIGKFTPNLKQKTIENYMGLWSDRKDDIDGALSITLYQTYLVSHDEVAEKKILLHNSDDVKQLYRILFILPRTDFHKAMCSYGFPLNDDAFIKNIALNKNILTVNGEITALNAYYRCYDDDAGIYTDINGNNLSVNIKLINEENLLFADLNAIDIPQETFANCGGLVKHYLVISEDGNINFDAAASLGKYLTERIIKNGLR